METRRRTIQLSSLSAVSILVAGLLLFAATQWLEAAMPLLLLMVLFTFAGIGLGWVALWSVLRARRYLRLALAAVLPPFALSLGLAVSVLAHVATNNVLLLRFSNQLFDFPLPPGSVLVDQSARVGICDYCNGDHCDFLVSRTLRTSASVAEVRSYYHGQVFSPAIPWLSHRAELYLEVATVPVEGGEPGVRISLDDIGYPTGLDPRCT